MVSSSFLIEDILIEIFTYLPLTSIYRFKSVSKVWLSILSNPNFITKWFHVNNKSLPWIQYHTIFTRPYNKNALKFRNSYPDLHSQFISRNEHLYSFKFLINEKQFEGAKLNLLGSSNGLVLCYSVSPDGQGSYHVCNPLTQKWVSIPLPPRFQIQGIIFDVVGIACEFSLSTSCYYKIVYIPRFNRLSKIINVDVFCSGLGEWRTLEVSCDQTVLGLKSCYENAVTLDGVLFCMEGMGRMLVYNINQNNSSDGHRCNLINLPDAESRADDFGTYCSRILGESEGRICYGRTRVTTTQITVSVWVLDEDNWQMLHEDISVNDTLAENFSRIGDVRTVRILGFSPADRNVVLIGCQHYVWGFNIQTRSFEELRHSSLLTDRLINDTGKMFVPFVLKTMPTLLPPFSRMDT